LYQKALSVSNRESKLEVVINPDCSTLILSTAYARSPLVPSSAFGMILGTVSSGGPLTPYVKRRVQVNTIGSASVSCAMVAKGNIDFSGQNVGTDSFDSRDPNYSTNGRWDPAKTKDVGDVSTNT